MQRFYRHFSTTPFGQLLTAQIKRLPTALSFAATTVEYAFRFSTAPLGVARYKIAQKPPQKVAGYLPSPGKLKKAIAMNEKYGK